ncbi:MAG: arginine N-succinyltransferase [Phycisphaerales bacterium]|nr:arginine N-succinyltransferase [Phycisphaerales bacterium]
MFVIREAQQGDLDDLLALAKQTFFINLPPDRDIIASKIDQSQRSFASLSRAGSKRTEQTGKGKHPKGSSDAHGHAHNSGLRSLTGRSDLFMVVLQNLETGTVVGTSQVISSMGGPGHPRYFMTLRRVSNSSKSLGLGWTHLSAKLGKDETGPTEIGGLILNHAFRGHPARLGRLLSFARFHLMGLFPQRFSDHIVAEMLGPITRTGYNPFFEKFTRHFITRAFSDIYRFSQTSREFVETLLPADEIYLSILDPEVSNAAGEVSEDTRPARRLLERLGFEYHNRIDPLDGGPHLEAKTKLVPLVKATTKLSAVQGVGRRVAGGTIGLVSTLRQGGHFRLLETPLRMNASTGKGASARKGATIGVSDEAAEVLGASEAEVVGHTPELEAILRASETKGSASRLSL